MPLGGIGYLVSLVSLGVSCVHRNYVHTAQIQILLISYRPLIRGFSELVLQDGANVSFVGKKSFFLYQTLILVFCLCLLSVSQFCNQTIYLGKGILTLLHTLMNLYYSTICNLPVGIGETAIRLRHQTGYSG